MNIVNKLTLRQLQKNKKRTIVTVIGVVISVAMIMAVMTIGISFLDMFKRSSIENSGAWEAQYHNVSANKLSIVEGNKGLKSVALVHKQGAALITDVGLDEKYNKDYIEVFALDEQAYDMYSVRLLEGRLPETSNEIVVPEALMTNKNIGKLSVGDNLTLNLGQRQAYNEDGTVIEDFVLTHVSDNVSELFRNGSYEELINTSATAYTIVGIIKDTVWEVAWGGSQIALTALDRAALSDTDVVDMVGTIYSSKTRAMFDDMEALAQQLGVEYRINHELLRYSLLSTFDTLQATLYSLISIIMLIVMIGSVSLIYNAFGISVADRSKYLGMLASIGATKRQKRNSVFYEASLISLVSIPLGLLGGYVGLLVTFEVINNIFSKLDMLNMDAGLQVTITPYTIVLSVVLSLITIFISAWLPARRASKITAIEAIRMSYDVKLTKRQVKNNRLVRKLFGIEADIALKNLKRNKRRYQVTVFSLVISIVLFISASYFSSMLIKGNELASDDIQYQVTAGIYHHKDVEFDREPLVEHEDIEDYAFTKSYYASVNLPSQHFSDSLKKRVDAGYAALNEDGSHSYSLAIYGLDDDSFNQYVQEQQLSGTNFYEDSQLKAILLNKTVFNSSIEQKKIEDVLLKEADQLLLPLYIEIGNEGREPTIQPIEPVTIAAVTEKAPDWVSISASIAHIPLIMPESQIEKLAEHFDNDYIEYNLLIKSSNPTAVADYLVDKRIEAVDVNMNIWNVNDYVSQMKGIVYILNIFTYGFIGLITIISLANIMNTISTALQLRKREFAMLRSMGMTKKGFYRMINYESIFYGIKSLGYGLPISFILIYLMYMSMNASMEFKFEFPWLYFLIAVAGIFVIVTFVMYYAGSKIKKGSIVEAIKQDNI